MKHQILSMLLVVLLGAGITSCEKDNNNGDINIAQNTWKLLGITYNVDASIGPEWDGGDFSLSAVTTGGENAIQITFNNRPSAGNYKIMNGGIVDPEDLNSDECLIFFTTATAPNLYWSSGKAGDVVKVAISGSKLRVTYNDIEVSFSGSSGIETSSSSAHLLEK